MKVHLVTLTVVEFDEVGSDEVKSIIESYDYPSTVNRMKVLSVRSRDIGLWDDNQAFKYEESAALEVERLFGPIPKD